MERGNSSRPSRDFKTKQNRSTKGKLPKQVYQHLQSLPASVTHLIISTSSTLLTLYLVDFPFSVPRARQLRDLLSIKNCNQVHEASPPTTYSSHHDIQRYYMATFDVDRVELPTREAR
jgi:hypothetical protein